MKKKKMILASLLAVILVCASFLGGLLVGKTYFPQKQTSFYAVITDISCGSEKPTGFMLVTGIPENDVNHRGNFLVSLDTAIAKHTIFDEQGKRINQTMLSPLGILVQITYSGPVLETSPAQIQKADSIRIIEKWNHEVTATE